LPGIISRNPARNDKDIPASSKTYLFQQFFKMAVAGNHLVTALHTGRIDNRIGHGQTPAKKNWQVPGA